jgi:hypothetical protein
MVYRVMAQIKPNVDGTSGTVSNKHESSKFERQTVRLWPDAGRTIGLGRAAAYEAAKRGQIPVLRFGRRLLVPRKALDRLLDGLDFAAQPAASGAR